MQLPGTRGSQVRDFTYRADGTLTGGGASVLVLPEAKSRSFLSIQNISTGGMYLEFGPARATAVLTGSIITSFSMTNVGFGYTLPPLLELFGGGGARNTANLGCGLIGYESPSKPGSGHCLLTGGTVSSIFVDNGGAAYKKAPYVQLINSILDPFGCADPSVGGGSGFLLGAGQSWTFNGTFCTTDACALYGTGSGSQAYTCMYAP